MKIHRISLLLSSILLFTAIASAKSIKLDGITYSVISGTPTVKISKCERSGNIAIPTEVSDKKDSYIVIAVGPKAFTSVSEPFSLNLPESVADIGKEAFSNSGLQSINMPGVRLIGEKAFANCRLLKDIVIPASVERIDGGAFDNTSLSHLAIADSDNPINVNNSFIPGFGIFGSGIDYLYLGRTIISDTPPCNGKVASTLKGCYFRKGCKMTWVAPMPKCFPAKAEEKLIQKSFLSAAEWSDLEQHIDELSQKGYAQALEEQKQAELRKAEEERQQQLAKEQEWENQLDQIVKYMDSHKSNFYTPIAGGGIKIKLDNEPLMEMYEGDYSNPFPGMLNGPVRNLSITVTPTTITIHDVEEIQVACDFNERTGAPARPADPFKEELGCSKNPQKETIPSLAGLRTPITTTCTHSMYKTNHGPYSPYRVKHTMTTTYNLNAIAAENKTTVGEVLKAFTIWSIAKNKLPEKITHWPDGQTTGEWVYFDGTPTTMSESMAWIAALTKMRRKLKK